MERQIKFRGKEINSGLWVYGFYVQGSFIDPVNNTEEVRHIIHSDVLCDVEEDSVAQFTGYYGEDGKEIYEGDLFRIKTRFGYLVPDSEEVHPSDEGYAIFSVKWFDSGIDGWRLVLETFSKDKPRTSIHPLWMCRNRKVIGNIHDNPELLKGGNP